MSAPVVVDVDTRSPGVRAVFSTREGGCSDGAHASLNLGATTGDDPDAVRRNRRALAGALGFDPSRAACLTQVHGAQVVPVGPAGGAGAFDATLEGIADADAMITRARGVALLAMGADCPVIVLWDDAGDAVGAAHAGWRGIVAGVVGAAVGAMGTSPSALRAAVGPHVGPCCYPVDADLRATMADGFGDDVVRGEAVDLGLACRRSLEQAGVRPEAIEVSSACTSCDARRFFSYRRDGAATGRQAAVIWMEDR